MGDRRDRGPVAVLHRTGVPAGAVEAMGGQSHHQPGGVGRPNAVADHRRVPGPGRARGRRRRLPRQATADARDDVDHPATGQRLLVRHRATADRPTRAPGVEGSQAGPARRPGHRRGLAEDRRVPVRAHRDRAPGPACVHLVRQLRQHPRPVRAGPRARLDQRLRPGPVHPRSHRHPGTDRRTVRDALVDRAGQRRRQAAGGCRAGP